MLTENFFERENLKKIQKIFAGIDCYCYLFPVGGMQEPCTERKCEAASPPVEDPPEPPSASPPPWTPEHFLQ